MPGVVTMRVELRLASGERLVREVFLGEAGPPWIANSPQLPPWALNAERLWPTPTGPVTLRASVSAGHEDEARQFLSWEA